MRTLFVLFAIITLFPMCAARQKVKSEYVRIRTMRIKNVNLNRVPDGTYTGKFSYAQGRAQVEVNVLVKDKTIVSIEIVKGGMNKHGKRAEVIVHNIIKKQTPNVDAITGATTTSKALCKAVENALTGRSE